MLDCDTFPVRGKIAFLSAPSLHWGFVPFLSFSLFPCGLSSFSSMSFQASSPSCTNLNGLNFHTPDTPFPCPLRISRFSLFKARDPLARLLASFPGPSLFFFFRAQCRANPLSLPPRDFAPGDTLNRFFFRSPPLPER